VASRFRIAAKATSRSMLPQGSLSAPSQDGGN
jgi:hypothetical protein